MVEIARKFDQKEAGRPLGPMFMMQTGLQDLFRNDEVIADEECNRFSLKPEH